MCGIHKNHSFRGCKNQLEFTQMREDKKTHFNFEQCRSTLAAKLSSRNVQKRKEV